MCQTPSPHTWGRSTSRSLVLLSGEGTTIPAAEAEAVFLTYDPSSTFLSPEPRVLIAESRADPFKVGGRIAFARRVGVFLNEPSDALPWLANRRVRFRCFDLCADGASPDPGEYLRGVDATVDLRNPDYELSMIRGKEEYLAVTAPRGMRQDWSLRRPRKRPYFHPSAIFPKLSRALVNMSRCREGNLFVEPFAGTGSIALEAHLVGAEVVAIDISPTMALGALANMRHFGQEWLGVIRGDAAAMPLRRAAAAATDVPYGRASSTRGRDPSVIMENALDALDSVLGSGSRAVVMHPQSLKVDPGARFSVEEEHNLHVHKLLTRTITVLERK